MKARLVSWMERRQPVLLEAARLSAWSAHQAGARPMQALVLVATLGVLVYAGIAHWPDPGAWWLTGAAILATVIVGVAGIGFAHARASEIIARLSNDLAELRNVAQGRDAEVAQRLLNLEAHVVASNQALGQAQAKNAELASRLQATYSAADARASHTERDFDGRIASLAASLQAVTDAVNDHTQRPTFAELEKLEHHLQAELLALSTRLDTAEQSVSTLQAPRDGADRTIDSTLADLNTRITELSRQHHDKAATLERALDVQRAEADARIAHAIDTIDRNLRALEHRLRDESSEQFAQRELAMETIGGRLSQLTDKLSEFEQNLVQLSQRHENMLHEAIARADSEADRRIAQAAGAASKEALAANSVLKAETSRSIGELEATTAALSSSVAQARQLLSEVAHRLGAAEVALDEVAGLAGAETDLRIARASEVLDARSRTLEAALRSDILDGRRFVVDSIGAANVAISALATKLADIQIFQASSADRGAADLQNLRQEAIDTAAATRRDLDAAIAALAAEISELDSKNAALLEELAGHLGTIRKIASLQSSIADQAAAAAALAEETAKTQKATDDIKRDVQQVRALTRRLSGANAANARVVDRLLTHEQTARLEQHWLKVFSLTMTRSALAYLAHQICLAEDRCDGRLACPIETALLRQLALHSLRRGQIEVLEIGTLFGIGGGVLHRHPGPHAERIFLTLLDPLEGYYDAGLIDPTSGVPVTRATLEKNLAALNVPPSNYRIIQRRSTDPHAVKEAIDRAYDFVLIDGDHSVAGVARDFELYGPMVRPGGLLLFDDYANPDWPGIQPYVDEYARAHPDWMWVGGEFRTGILRRKSVIESARDPSRSHT